MIYKNKILCFCKVVEDFFLTCRNIGYRMVIKTGRKENKHYGFF